ncbi:hypothetical protein SEA_GODONK_73 [Gordonia phage GodonK]|uniref:Capsid maturation protease n=1 Tax=Gordonia phage GodonK TaxID=2562192 RepID=A0A4D6E3S2_9CAUD|nr:head maturation protease [Gordonia phage GodonK]QBZ72692.1 hypothetical protein SEA_GODONK_73 [Gordonia phage GodonK]
MGYKDGTYEQIVDDSTEIVRALVAGAAPMYPPTEWFEDPKLSKTTPITVTADGRVYGHIADWNQDHIGLPERRAPRSQSNYAFFKTGVVKTAEGTEVPVGNLTLAGGHAPLNASAGDAVAHYDDTASAIADVNVGEDAHGIWVSGGLRPNVDEGQIRALRASAPSGDWRPINRSLELVAVCQVNTPGFPIARSLVASGEIMSLVAAGASSIYELQQERVVMESVRRLADRVEELEAVVAGGAKKKFGDNEDPAKDSDGATDDSGDDSRDGEDKTDVNKKSAPNKTPADSEKPEVNEKSSGRKIPEKSAPLKKGEKSSADLRAAFDKKKKK